MEMTTGQRTTDGGTTEITIADGLIYVDIFRGKVHIEQRRYDAVDLVNMNLDAALLSGSSTRPQRARAARASRKNR